MKSTTSSQDGPSPDPLSPGSEKSFEIASDENTAEPLSVQANQDGQIVESSVENIVDQKPTLEYAAEMVGEILNAKPDEGRELIKQGKNAVGDKLRILEEKKVEEEEKKEEPKAFAVDSKTKRASLTKIIASSDEIRTDQVGARAAELKVDYDTGNEAAVNELADFIWAVYISLQPVDMQLGQVGPQVEKRKEEKKEEHEGNMQPDQDQVKPQVEKRKEDEANKEEEKESKTKEEDLSVYTQKELVLYPALEPHLKQIEIRAENMQLTYDYDYCNNKLLVAGFETRIIDFMTWLFSLTAKSLDNVTNELKTIKLLKQDNNEFMQDEISISTFHRIKKDQILNYARLMKLNCQFGYDVILVDGNAKTIREFKSYLHEIETKAKKSLYPRYWDFHNIDIYSEIEINAFSKEFQEVRTLFKQTLPNATVHKLTRIQNKYLMEHYVTMLQKRQELNPNSVINRKLLFHGTRTIRPEEVYKNFDTGFDLQFANASGMYGKGLYFASGANYSHNGFVYSLGNGRFQMLLADVFVGNAYRSDPNRALIKAPAGYDSVEATNPHFYVIYNNFHSYPLYLIEYQV